MWATFLASTLEPNWLWSENRLTFTCTLMFLIVRTSYLDSTAPQNAWISRFRIFLNLRSQSRHPYMRTIWQIDICWVYTWKMLCWQMRNLIYHCACYSMRLATFQTKQSNPFQSLHEQSALNTKWSKLDALCLQKNKKPFKTINEACFMHFIRKKRIEGSFTHARFPQQWIHRNSLRDILLNRISSVDLYPYWTGHPKTHLRNAFNYL